MGLAGTDPPEDPLALDEIEALFPRPFSFFGETERPPTRPTPGLEVGRVIGDFRLVECIGQGGMGQVWKAEQLSLGGRVVALKFVRPERITPRQLRYFEREARAGGRLSHPGLVSLLGFGEAEGVAWIAMEYVAGQWTLRDTLDELARLHSLPADYDQRIARLVLAVAEAMQAAHERGVVHRDLKPQNILITDDEQPKVTDFGLARLSDETALSQTGELVGTYYYMSPEQLRGDPSAVDARADVFGLGVMFYELLTLQRPFQGDTTHVIANRILTTDPVDPRTIRTRIPRDLSVICGKALEKAPEARYASMSALADDLERHLAHRPITARPPTRLQCVLKWTRRNRLEAAFGGVIFLALMIVSALALDLHHTNEDLRESEERAVRNAVAARSRTEQVLRLSLIKNYEALVERADALWPVMPENELALIEWERDARKLEQRLTSLRTLLSELRDSSASDYGISPNRGGGIDDAAEPQLSIPWWVETLEELIGDLESLSDVETGLLSENGASLASGWSIPRRIEFLERTLREFSQDGQAARAWRDALPAIRRDYPGQVIGIQVGLVPIGTDPDTGLWEFAHLASGTPAGRDDSGKLRIEESTGIVFVLLPETTFRMGTQNSNADEENFDADSRNDERPPHDVHLTAHFMSKFEVTQAQWFQLTGENPSYHDMDGLSASLLHPVESVSWADCALVLGRFGLRLPSEAEWERAARGGTSTPWWTGEKRESLRGAVNIADESAVDLGVRQDHIDDWPGLYDGFPAHSPVDALPANPLGLHGVHGNVWEWCEDLYASRAYTRRSRLDPVVREGTHPKLHIFRGGSYGDTAAYARVAYRNVGADGSKTMGVRPARSIQ